MAAAQPIGEKRICLLTGASGRLGTVFCRQFRNRYHIAAVYRNHLPQVPSQHCQFVDPLSTQSGAVDPHPVFAIKANLFEDVAIQKVVDLTLARFERIDLLVNAAVESTWAPAVTSNELIDSAGRQFELNVIVPLKIAVAVAREFWRNRDKENAAANRNVVNVSSTSGVYVYPDSDQSVYSASKAALNYLGCHMAQEFATFNVRVNTIAPTAFPRIITTRSVAHGIHRLDREKMSGQILIIDSDGELLYTP